MCGIEFGHVMAALACMHSTRGGPTGSKGHKWNEITCLYKPNGDHTWGFFTAVPPSFHQSDQFLDSPDNMLTNNVLYPWGTSVGKDKHGLSIGSAKVKHDRKSRSTAPAMRQSLNYIRSSFLSNLLWHSTHLTCMCRDTSGTQDRISFVG